VSLGCNASLSRECERAAKIFSLFCELFMDGWGSDVEFSVIGDAQATHQHACHVANVPDLSLLWPGLAGLAASACKLTRHKSRMRFPVNECDETSCIGIAKNHTGTTFSENGLSI
jgi:hypothetical protein